MSIVRVAVVQAAPVAFDRDRSLEKTRDLVSDAAGQGRGSSSFPRRFSRAIRAGSTSARVGSRTPEGREFFRRYWESSVDVPGPATEVLGVAARQAKLTSSSA